VLVTITNLEGDWTKIKTGDVIQYKSAESLAVFDNAFVEKQLKESIEAQIANGKSMPFQIDKGIGEKVAVFIEILLPELRLVLMGHQYDIYPLARLTKEIGWQVTMVSNPLKINVKLSATVDAIFSYEQLNEIQIDQYTAIVLMSHDYKTDKANLPKVLQTDAFYIGMLGPKVRSEKIFNELGKEGRPVADENMERIFAPAGLDIGALSPEEIALSIIAEIKTVFSKRGGTFLKFRHSPIHERS
jgi:xanthine/CO dehydrogenase XdhC/CoxF family maturation factor